MTRLVLLIGGMVTIAAIVAAILLLRPGTSTTSTVDPDMRVECSGATGVGEAACRDWGDSILAEGSPTTTFEAEDVVRLRLDRELLGFGDACRAQWFLGRYPDDVAWSEAVACADR